MIYKKIFLLSILIAYSLQLSAQSSKGQIWWKRSRAEFVFGFGVTNFLGELGGADQIGTNGLQDLEFPATRPLVTIGYYYKFSKRTGFELSLVYGSLSGNDNLTNELFRKNRNLHFSSPIVEFSGKYQLQITHERRGHIYRLRGVKGMKNIQVVSYGFIGLGGFYFNPKAQYKDGQWYSLQPLHTEGQEIYPTRKAYSRFQVCIPYGLGIKWLIFRDWLIGIEFGARKVFTDYLDDVSLTYPNKKLLLQYSGPEAVYFSDPSLGLPGTEHATEPNQQRGDPSDKDMYMFAAITFRYRIPYSQKFLGISRF